MNIKNVLKSVLFPNIYFSVLILPAAAAALVYSMLFLEENNPIRIASYVAAFYTLLIWCLKMPEIILFFKNIKRKNKYLITWSNDPGLRINITLCANVAFNGAYAVLQLGMGIYHRSAWFYSLAVYYASLAVMRFFIVRHTLHHKTGENIIGELKRCKICGKILLVMNFGLAVMIFYMVRQNRVVHHSEITTIALATYTFTALVLAVVNSIKYRKYNSPAMSAAKTISLLAACVSMLTLENTMLNTFDKNGMAPQTKRLFLVIGGGAISVLIIITAIYTIGQSSKKLNTMEN